MKKSVFAALIMVLILPSALALAANIRIDFTIGGDIENYTATVKNTGKDAIPVTHFYYFFNNQMVSNELSNNTVIEPGGTLVLPIVFNRPQIPGSYSVIARLHYKNDNTVLSRVAGGLVHFEKKLPAPVKFDLRVPSFITVGRAEFGIAGNIEIQNLRLIPPAEYPLIAPPANAARPAQGRFAVYISNLVPTFTVSNSLYLVYDAVTSDGHTAAVAEFPLLTGQYYYHLQKNLIPGIIAMSIAALVLILLFAAGFIIKKKNPEKGRNILYAAGILAVSFLLYITLYFLPASPFWDENYHVASAYKYLNGVFFMEPHPPLGKMLIALGERIIPLNSHVDTSVFLNTDYLKSFPLEFTYFGVRLFPVLFAVGAAFLFYLLLFRLVPDRRLAFLFSSLYLFNNALVVHLRGAMLDPFQLFFVMLALLLFARAVQDSPRIRDYVLLALAVGLAIMVKVNSAIMLLLFVFLAVYEYRRQLTSYSISLPDVLDVLKKALISGAVLLVTMGAVWYVHFAICGTARGDRYYNASADVRRIVDSGETANPLHFSALLRDNMRYMNRYQLGVPRLDVNKVGENGSYPLWWPLGKKPINYSWWSYDGKIGSLTLVPNPVSWLAALAAFILAGVLILSRFVFGLNITNKRLFWLSTAFFTLYSAYMVSVAAIERVMYLYHYFIPLIFGLVLIYLLYHTVFEKEIAAGDRIVKTATLIFLGLNLAVFLYQSPLNMYIPLDMFDFFNRQWLPFWGMDYAGL